MSWTVAATRVEHRDAALACLMVAFRGCATRARTSLSGRSRQDASELAGLDQGVSDRLACPVKSMAKPCASRRTRARFATTIRKNRSGNRVCRPQWLWSALADAKKKNPRMGIRGRSRASEIGATDLRKGISRDVCRCRAACAGGRNPSAARMRPHRDGSATCRTGWRCGRRVSSEDSAGIRGVPAALKRSAAAMGAHVTPVFFRLQTFFSQVDERLDEWIGAAQSCGVRTMPARTCAQTMPYKRKRAAEAARESYRCRISDQTDYFGSSTLSITWITPLL